MNKLPAGWEIKKLKDICTIQDGIHKTPKYTSKGIKFVSVENINDLYNSNKFISEEDYNKMYKIKAKKNDIFMTRIGDIGTPAILNKDEKLAYYVTLCLFTNIDEEVFNKYLYYAIQSNYFKKELYHRTLHVAFPKKINLGDIGDCKFILPPLDEQKRIASILSALDDKIELNNKTNKILEEMAQTIFKEWFINFNFPNEDGKPYKKSGGEMIDSELGKIPKGWKVITLKDIISIAKGKKPNATSDKITEKFTMPYLTINCYNNEATEYTEYNEKMHVKELDIVMVMDGNAGKIFYGKEGILSSTMAKLIVEDSNLNELVFYFLKSIEYDLMYHTVGSVIQHADKQYMLNKKFCVSSDNLERLSDIFKCIRKEISLNKKENEKLSNIRDSLLPKLMTPKGRRADGEIRI